MKNRLDYVMFTPSYPPEVGGVERHVKEVHHALKRKSLVGKILVIRGPPPSHASAEDVLWMGHSKLWRWVPKTSRFKRIYKLVSYILQHRQAILHFHDFGTIYPVLPILKILNLLPRTYLTFHGWEGKCPPEEDVIRKRQKCARMVVANMAVGDFIPKWYHTKADAISYGGVNPDHYRQLRNECNELPLRIAYIGRLEPDTGVEELVAATEGYCRLSKRNVELSLYGNGSMRESLGSLQAETPFSFSISPPVPDVISILADYPIIFASGYLTILEALCARRIVFTYYNNPLREDYLRLHPAARSMFVCGSIQDVKRGLAQCGSNIADVCQRAKPGWLWAREQSWDAVARKYLAMWGLRA